MTADETQILNKQMNWALEAAWPFVGATAPNPPVGAALFDREGKILVAAAHEKAGLEHAEAKAIRIARDIGRLKKAHTLAVTLEPCTHFGKQPPCIDAVLKSGVKRVLIGTRDPNPVVNGKAVEKLREAGIEVLEGILEKECKALIRPFAHWIQTGQPWVVVKRALNENGSMIPPQGQKTFTSEKSLQLAHLLRKRADAILTTGQTIVKDQPKFTVRHVPDHPEKKRILAVVDRRKQIPEGWISGAKQNGFEILEGNEISELLETLGKKGVNEVLVEAGPTFSEAILASGFWNQEIVFKKGEPDRVQIRLNESLCVGVS